MSFVIHTFKMPHGVRTYLLVDKKTGKAIIIDPTTENKEVYYDFLAKNKQIHLTHVLDTHTHADHVSLAKELKEKIPGIRYGINTNAPTTAKDLPLLDREIIEFGDSHIVCMYTPGHTNDSMTYVGEINDRKLLFTGDTLLLKGTGRTDFQEGNSQRSFDSLMQIMRFPDDTIVYPGHDYDDKLESTIGEIRKSNPRVALALDSEVAYVEFMDKNKPPLPELFGISIAENSK